MQNIRITRLVGLPLMGSGGDFHGSSKIHMCSSDTLARLGLRLRHFLSAFFTFLDHLNYAGAEGIQIVRAARGDNTLIRNNLIIGP